VLRNKYKPDGTLDRRKARIVARGFAQIPGIDFSDTFAPVTRLELVRTIVALAAEEGMTLHHFDIATAYLNGKLKEKVFIEIPKHTILSNVLSEGISVDIRKKAKGMLERIKKGDKVCLLNKSLYGLRQAGRCWNARINEKLLKYGARKSSADPCLYHKGAGADQILIAVYVDDLIVASQNEKKIKEFGRYLSKIFSVTDLGPIKHCLGMEITQQEDQILICKICKADILPISWNVSECPNRKASLHLWILEHPWKSLASPDTNGKETPYRELVGALTYLAVCMRPDIAYAVSYLSQFNSCYSASHWTAAKRVLPPRHQDCRLKVPAQNWQVVNRLRGCRLGKRPKRQKIVHRLLIYPWGMPDHMGGQKTEDRGSLVDGG